MSARAPASGASLPLAYHRFRGRLGMGDLHPGGEGATAELLARLSACGVRRVLEIGAGIGNTTARMIARGWEVTALEPDPVLYERLRRRAPAVARCEPFLRHAPATRYEAIVAESVLFQMDLPEAFNHAAALLEPGGYLAFIEAVWTERITAALSRALHENTRQLFGIAVGTREPLTWDDWLRCLRHAGFSAIHSELLTRGSAGHPPTRNRAATLLAVVRDPRLLIWMARFRSRKRSAKMPSGIQESRLFLGRLGASAQRATTR